VFPVGPGDLRPRGCIQLGDQLPVAFGATRMQAADSFLGAPDHATSDLARLAHDPVRLLLAVFNRHERVLLGVKDERYRGVDRQIIIGLGIHAIILGKPVSAGNTW